VYLKELNMEEKCYVTCWICKRDFEIKQDKDRGKMWGRCPICKTVYKDINVPYWKK